MRGIQGQDDGAFLAYWATDHYFEYVDARVLTFMIRGPGVKSASVANTFDLMIDCMGAQNPPINEIVLDSGGSYGTIDVLCAWGLLWFKNPLEWYKKGDTILFAAEKQTRLPRTRRSPWTAWKNVIPKKVIGGIPYSDSRPFIRFGPNANHETLAKEYFDAMVGVARAEADLAAEKWRRSDPDPLRTFKGPLRGRYK